MNIKQFAQELGVSPTTVSRALSGRGRVSDRTREMIRDRMSELGYTPNIQAQRLVTGRAFTIALDWSGTPDPSVAQDFYLSQLIDGIQAALQRRGYGLLLCGPHRNDFVQRWVAGRAVDGVIFVSDNDEEAIAAEVTLQGAPCVVLSHRALEERPLVGAVVLNLEMGIHEVADTLIDYGHRQIAFVGSRPEDDALNVFAGQLAKRGVVLSDRMIRVAGLTAKDGERALDGLWEQPEPPTAIFARTDLLAVGIVRAAHRRGIQIPGQLSVVGHDDIRVAELIEPALTTVRIEYNLLGERAAERMVQLIEEPEIEVASPILHTRLILRETLAPVRKEPLS